MEKEKVSFKKYGKNIFIFSVVFLLGVITALGLKNYIKAKPINTCDIVSKEEVVANIKNNLKDAGEFTVGDCVIPGLREITVVKTGEIFYTDAYGKNVIIGMLFNEKGENITQQKYSAFIKKQNEETLKTLDKGLALKFGNGSKEVLEFTDIDCPYCIAAEEIFKNEIKDVTRYVYLTPIDALHPQAKKKSIHILCSENKEVEYEKVMKGEITEFKECDKGVELLNQHKKYADSLKLQGTPLFFYNGLKYSGLTKELINILKAE